GCDRIIALDGGRVAEVGSHQDLIAQDGVYRRLMAEQAREAPVGDAGAPAPVARPAATAETVADVPGGAIAAPTEGVVAAEGMTWARVVRVLMGLIWPWRGALGLTFVFGVGRVLAYVGVGICSALTIFALKNGTPFEGYLWALAALAPLAGLLHWFESWIAHDMAFRLLAEMRIAYFRKLDQLAPAYLVRRRTGDLMAIATHDIELVEYFFAHTVAPAFVALVAPAAILAVLASYSPWLAGVLLPFLVIVGCSPRLFRKRVDRLGARAREAAGELGAHAVDSVQGLGEIIAFQQENARGDAFDRLGAAHVRLRLPFFNELTWQQTSLEVMTGFGALAVAVTGGWLAAHGAVDSGILPLLTLLALAAFLPVSEIAQIGRQLADTLGSTRRVYSIQAEHVAVTDGAGVAGDGRAAAWALDGVDFSYPGTARKALAGVSFAVPAGQTTALVGTSGAGKTTSAQLLMRFWDPDAGRITLNGQDLRDYQLDDLRARIALVAQDTYLFNDTLRANIMIAKPEASGAELAAAVDNAALGDLVAALPQGLETPVGERGASLSGGQRQRVAIARAFLKDAPVLILDEATSHLDAVNEAAVRQALERLKTARTTIVIAHRLSTVRDADHIVVLEAGRMVEYGDHDTLLAAGGLYTQLVRHQVAAGQAAAE
ncbi:MAG: ATP-binding cassette domain-containing protein, partial [Pseudomonadota bacterium]|nr:ATP-binding cassette domain-containing protein [Pseudomonadota bacterium]